MVLTQAIGVLPGSKKHSYQFSGNCILYGGSRTSHMHYARPVAATANWDLASHTYQETLHLLAAENIHGFAVTTAPEYASFKCDVDPVIYSKATCTLEVQLNSTGWGYTDTGFAEKAAHYKKPLLAGASTLDKATSLSRKYAKQFPAIQCSGLHLIAATGALPGKKKHTYKLNGTCQLYHTKDGKKGLEVTHVLVHADWDGTGQRAREGVTVLTKSNEGGGGWTTTYTCDDDPWLNPHAKCSKTSRLGNNPPVYKPITDLIDRHPVAQGKINGDQAIKLSKQKNKKSGNAHSNKHAKSDESHNKTIGKHVMGSLVPKFKSGAVAQRGRASTSPVAIGPRDAGLRAKKSDRQGALHLKLLNRKEEVHFACSNLSNIITLRQTILNDGAPLPARRAILYVTENAGAHIVSPQVYVPKLAHGARLTVLLNLGTQAAYLTKLPGPHRLKVRLSLNGKITTLKLKLKLPSNMCKTALSTGVKATTKLNPQPEPPSAQLHLALPKR